MVRWEDRLSIVEGSELCISESKRREKILTEERQSTNFIFLSFLFFLVLSLSTNCITDLQISGYKFLKGTWHFLAFTYLLTYLHMYLLIVTYLLFQSIRQTSFASNSPIHGSLVTSRELMDRIIVLSLFFFISEN